MERVVEGVPPACLKWRKLHPDISIYPADVDCIVLSRLRTLGGEIPNPRQPERILNDLSVMSTTIGNDSVLHQALDNGRDH